ncbi:MAG: DnaB helicase C-terminal domain-containing protein [Lentisphaeraceae bacterium]|nr:DnaB helicase C-terminal domain-containing protein [Lentisphaeraceae bacterium]
MEENNKNHHPNEDEYQNARNLLENGLQELLEYGSQLLKKKRFKELNRFVKDKTRSLDKLEDFKEMQPYSLSKLCEEINEEKEGLMTGWPALDKHIRIPQEQITIVAGQPSHGKTTIMMNLLLNMVKQYPNQTFLFFSYEENSKHLAIKSLMNFSEVCLDEASNFSRFEELIKRGDRSIPEVNNAIEKLQILTDTKRLWLLDHAPTLEDLIDELAYFTSEYNVGGVFIDYVQKMKSKHITMDRHKDLQYISNELLMTAKSMKIPMIIGAQLEKSKDPAEKVKLDQLRDSGDVEQDANLILGVYNKAMQKARTGVKITDRLIDLTVSVLKNRNGSVNQDVVLRFDRPVLKIRDFSTTQLETYAGPKLHIL